MSDLTLEAALDRILAVVPAPRPEEVPLAEADGRVLLQAVASSMDLPAFDNSAMDGYAVRSADVAAAGPDSPISLQVAGRIAAGETFSGEVNAGTCVRLFTGSPIPRGADAVIMQEDTQPGPGSNEVRVLDRARPFENLRLRGEDIKRGTVLAQGGEVLTAARLSAVAATGVARVKVGRQPLVGILATGSELQRAGEPLEPGKIYESNSTALASLVRGTGARPLILPLLPDVLSGTRQALTEAFRQSDAVITSGGVSVGELDFVKEAFAEIGGELGFWRVSIKPGRPFVFGTVQRGKREAGDVPGSGMLFGLPGNPVSAFVTFLLLVRPALLRWQGAAEVGLLSHPGVLTEPLANPGDRRHFMRVKTDNAGRVTSAGVQASHVLSSLAAANGLVDVAPQTTLAAGTTVQVLRWA